MPKTVETYRTTKALRELVRRAAEEGDEDREPKQVGAKHGGLPGRWPTTDLLIKPDRRGGCSWGAPGRLGHVRVGLSIRISEDQVQAYLEAAGTGALTRSRTRRRGRPRADAGDLPR